MGEQAFTALFNGNIIQSSIEGVLNQLETEYRRKGLHQQFLIIKDCRLMTVLFILIG